MKRGIVITILAIQFGSIARAAEYPEMKKKVATVAVFGLAGAGVGLLTVAASTDPQSRLGNIPAGLVVGAVVGSVYVFSLENKRTALWLTPMEQGAELALLHNF